MTQWLHERYISRVEHQEIVAYYKKLVVQLHGRLREAEARSAEAVSPAILPQVPSRRFGPPSGVSNVILFDPRRRH